MHEKKGSDLNLIRRIDCLARVGDDVQFERKPHRDRLRPTRLDRQQGIREETAAGPEREREVNTKWVIYQELCGWRPLKE